MKSRKKNPFAGQSGEATPKDAVLVVVLALFYFFYAFIAKPIIQTFLRYGFGERYYTLSTVIVISCFLWLWPPCVNYLANSKYSFLFSSDPAKQLEEYSAYNPFLQDTTSGSEADSSNESSSAGEHSSNFDDDDTKATSEKPKDTNADKFEKRYHAWTLMKWAFPIMAIIHLIFIRRRRKPDYDYSRISTFEGDSWYFIQFLGYHLKKELVFVRQVTTYLFEYTLTKLFYRFIWAKTLLLPPAPFVLDLKVYRIKAKEEAEHYYFDAIGWGVEPLLFFVCGILLMLMDQSLGWFLIFLSGVYLICTLTLASYRRMPILSKIDFYINQLSEKYFNRMVKDSMKESGVQFRPEQPSDDEILSHLAPHLHKGKERFIVK